MGPRNSYALDALTRASKGEKMIKWNIRAQDEAGGFDLNEVAEEVRITEKGDIYFLDANEEIVRLIANGNWTFVNLSNAPEDPPPEKSEEGVFTAPMDGVYSFEGVKVGDLPNASQNQSPEESEEEK